MKKIWLESYPEGVPTVIDPDEYTSLPEALNDFCRSYSQKRAFVNYGSSITYQALSDYSDDLAAFFQQELRLNPGERIALMMPNILQYPIAIFAALKSGLVIVNVNPLYTAAEVERELTDSGAKAIIVLDQFASVVQKILPVVDLQNVIVTSIGDMFGFFKGQLFNITAKKILRLVPAWKIESHYHFKKSLQKGRRLSFAPPVIQPNDLAFLQYTGGTTGQPKGAMLTHRNILANILQCRAWIRGNKTNHEILLAALPLYHIFSLTVAGFTFLSIGAECVLITDPRRLASLIHTWRKVSPTSFIGLNTLFLHLLNSPKFSKLNFHSLTLTVGGGMATKTEIAKRWCQVTGCEVTEGYGLTEASPVVSINPINSAPFKSSIGLPIPDTDIKIVDEANQMLEVDQVGELLVKGPQVMLGYWDNPQETDEILDSQGWLRTGDMARIDSQGYLYLVGRKKNLIIVSGFNVYPAEVEAVIGSHPDVADVVIIGEPSESTGEIVKALIVKKNPELSEKDLLEYCYQRLAHYKVPKKIEFVKGIAKTNLGKILRN